MDPTAATCHVVAIPYPGRGHINPMFNLCYLLASRSDDILISVFLTEEWLGFIGSEPKPPNLRCFSIPNVLPSELDRAARLAAFVDDVTTKMEEPCDRLLDRLNPPATAIVADTVLFWAVGMGNRRKIPVGSLWPTMAGLFLNDLSLQAEDCPTDISEGGEDNPAVTAKNKVVGLVRKGIWWAQKAQFMLFASVYELEAQTIDALKAEISFPVYPLGPLIPYYKLGHKSPFSHQTSSNSGCSEWLDSQPPASVLYISFGSLVSVSRSQMEEIAAGLQQSGVRFLWVARGDEGSIKEICGEMGLVVGWCNQLRVLCHGSVGGFWSHCGWSSVLEGVFAGLPFLTFPIDFDQFRNSDIIVEDWKIGWRVRREEENEVLINRDEIRSLVQRFMDLESNEGKEMRRKARELQEICRGATRGGGSSSTNLDAFARDILNAATVCGTGN